MSFGKLVFLSYFASAVAGSDPAFDQDLSFRSLFKWSTPVAGWPVQVFEKFPRRESVTHLNNGRDCFVAISDNQLYGASPQSSTDKLSLTSPYQGWKALSYQIVGGKMVVKSLTPDIAFFVLTSNQATGGILSESTGCGKMTNVKPLFFSYTEWRTLLAVAVSESRMWVASKEAGLQQFEILTGKQEDSIKLPDMNIKAMHFVPSWNKLFVSTPTALYTLTFSSTAEGGYTYTLEHEWITGVLDSAPVQFSFDDASDCLWIAQSGAVHKLDAMGRYWRFGYHQGAPFGSITSVAVTNGYVYIGSSTGGLARMKANSNPGQVDTLANNQPAVMIRPGGTSEVSLLPENLDPWVWSYYGGQRYLPDNAVSNLVAGGSINSTVVLAVTATGLAYIQTAEWTLSEKAAALERFQTPRHDRHGLTAECGLKEFGNLNTYYKRVGDNDGLWTSMHAIGEAYNYATTGSKAARDSAWRAFEALEMLSNATGAYPKYVARSYCFLSENDEGCGTADGVERWNNSTVISGVMWKSDTSSDEMNGHFAVYPVIYDLVASTAEEKQRVYALIDGITQGIVDNDLYLIDPVTNKPTTWGFWNPSAVNDNADHYSERDLNSLEIMGYLASAYSITRKVVYKDTFQKLVSQHGYGRNIMNVKIDNPDDDNHSDNELIMLAYHILFYAWRRVDIKTEPAFKAEMWEMVSIAVPSLERTWLLIGAEYSPLWTGIYAGVAAQPASVLSISRSAWTLRRWALDLVAWPVTNSLRWDLTVTPFIVRNSESDPLMRQIRPASERVSSHWNSDPYNLDTGSGYEEFEPAVWTLPYYLMKYYKLVQ